MACFAKFFSRKHGSFNLPDVGKTDDGIVVSVEKNIFQYVRTVICFHDDEGIMKSPIFITKV